MLLSLSFHLPCSSVWRSYCVPWFMLLSCWERLGRIHNSAQVSLTKIRSYKHKQLVQSTSYGYSVGITSSANCSFSIVSCIVDLHYYISKIQVNSIILPLSMYVFADEMIDFDTPRSTIELYSVLSQRLLAAVYRRPLSKLHPINSCLRLWRSNAIHKLYARFQRRQNMKIYKPWFWHISLDNRTVFSQTVCYRSGY